jgi:ParB family chromosome partitioning protein
MAIDKLVPHPDSPNRMGKGNFAKLIRNIERTARYEPLVIRPKDDGFQIINGHHRWRALRELGYKTVDAVIWDIDDADTDILLATLNRLGGSNVLEKKLALLGRLNERTEARDLAKRLPHSAKQIRRLTRMNSDGLACLRPAKSAAHQAVKSAFANPLVFFLSDAQHEIVEKALSLAQDGQNEKTKAARNAAALANMARCFIESTKPT